MLLFIGSLLAIPMGFPYYRKGKLKYKIVFGIGTVLMVLLCTYYFNVLGILYKWYIDLFGPLIVTFISNFIIHFLLFSISAEYRNESERNDYN